MNEIYRKIDAYLDSQKEAILETLEALVRIPSVGAPGEGGFPFGSQVDRLLHAVSDLFCAHGYAMETKSDAGYSVWHEAPENPERIGIFAHGDVVPVAESEWLLTKPFEPRRIEHLLIGRGAWDNKSGIVGALYALNALREAGVTRKHPITVFVGGNEESGMEDIKAYTRTEPMPVFSFVPDTSFPYSEGEKGILRLNCTSSNPLRQITDFTGGEAYNIILPLADVTLRYDEALFAELQRSGAAVSAENGVITLHQKGIPGHAAAPHGTESAAYGAAKLLCSMEQLCKEDREILSCLCDVLKDGFGTGLGIAGEDVFGILTAGNGMVRMEDGHLTFTLDIRYGTGFDGDALVEAVRETLARYDFTVSVHSRSDGFLLADDPACTNALLRAYQSFGGSPEEKPFKSSGGTYAKYLRRAYSMGTDARARKEILNLPAGHGNAHQSDECVDTDGLLQGIKTLAAMLYEVDKL